MTYIDIHCICNRVYAHDTVHHHNGIRLSCALSGAFVCVLYTQHPPNCNPPFAPPLCKPPIHIHVTLPQHPLKTPPCHTEIPPIKVLLVFSGIREALASGASFNTRVTECHQAAQQLLHAATATATVATTADGCHGDTHGRQHMCHGEVQERPMLLGDFDKDVYLQHRDVLGMSGGVCLCRSMCAKKLSTATPKPVCGKQTRTSPL